MIPRIVIATIMLALYSPAHGQSERPLTAFAIEAQQAQADGAALADAVTTATGLSMSPLLGMSAVGAWRWYSAAAVERVQLPWHQQPWFWVSGLVLLALFFVGDKIPGFRQFLKPLKLNQNAIFGSLSLLVTAERLATAGSTPVARALAYMSGLMVPTALASTGGEGFPSGIAVSAAWAVALVGGALAAAAVWLVFNAVDVLVLLSPFAPLDALLRSARFVPLAILVVATAISPTLGASVAGAILVGSLLLAGWAFRLTVLGAVVSWDFLMFRRKGPGRDGSVRAFATNVPNAPRRSWGTVSITGATLTFTWRPWLVFPARSATLPPAASVGIGFLSPVVFAAPADGGHELVRLPPRYRGAHAEIAAALGGLAVIELPLVRGIRAAVAWVRGTANQGLSAMNGRQRLAG